MIYKKIEIEEMEHFWSLLNALDAETNFMMYEPNERKQHMDIQELETDIYHNVIHGNDFLQIAKADNKIVGYLRAERGEFHRNFHTAYIVVGVLNEYQGKAIKKGNASTAEWIPEIPSTGQYAVYVSYQTLPRD